MDSPAVEQEQISDAEIKLPDLPSDDATKKAREKIVDLSEDKEHFLHSTTIQMLPAILEDGIVSIAFAQRGLKYKNLPSNYEPVAQSQRESGSDLISVYDPGRSNYGGWWRRSSRETGTIQDALTNEEHRVGVGELSLLISPRLEYRRVKGCPIYPAEAFLKRRVAPRDFDGVVMISSYAEKPLSGLDKSILLDTESYRHVDHVDKLEQIRDRFMLKHTQDPSLRGLYKKIRNNREELETAWHNLMNIFGFGQNNPYSLNFHSVHSSIPGAFNEFKDGIIDFYKQNNEVRLRIVREWPNGLNKLDQYIKDFKAKAAAMVQDKGRMTFGDVVKMLGMGTGEPEIQIKKGWLARLFPGTTSQIPKLHALETEAPVDEIVALMEKILEIRKERVEFDQTLWGSYIETVTGKKIGDATLGDFVLGLCKQKGLPLYNEKGEVLWPK